MSFLDKLLGGPRVKCDHCGKTFVPKLVDVPSTGGGRNRLFECPSCKAPYVVARITKRGVDLMRQLQTTPVADAKRVRHLRQEIKREVLRP